MMAGIAVTAAEPSGLWGTLKESFSSAQALAAGKTGSSELVKALVADLETSEGRGIVRETEGATERQQGGRDTGQVGRRPSPGGRAVGDQSAAGRLGGEDVAPRDQPECRGGIERRRLSRLRWRAGE